MNHEESKEILQLLLRYFPDINGWLRANSPEPMATLRSWQRCLAQVPFAAAKSVLDDMEKGRVQPLEPNHRARTAIHIVELAREREQQRRQDVELIQRRQEFQRLRRQRQLVPGSDGASQ